jgi:bud site selection protein 20
MDETLPGLGQHYCVPCARYFVDIKALEIHEKSKLHKKALRRLKEEPFTHKDAEIAGKY